MTYSLQIDLIGGEKVESILQKLQGLTGALGQGGSIFGGDQSGGTSLISKQADDIGKLNTALQKNKTLTGEVKKEAQSVATNIAQGFNAGGWSKVFGSTVSKWSPTFLKNNPELAARLAQSQEAVAAGGSIAPRGRMQVDLKDAQAKAAAKSAEDAVTFKKDMSFLMMPLFNPGSMWATLFSGRQTYSALSGDAGKEFLAGKSGGSIGMLGGKLGKLSGGSAGAATGLLVGGATVLGLALKALTVTVKQTMAAYENARQIYAKALTNGMGTQFTVKRSMLAQIMGVSEQDVFRFGAQMAYLNPKLEWAANILSRTTTPLTQVSWEFKILGENTKAMFSSLSVEAAPALLVFTNSLSNLVKYITEHAHDFNKLMLGNGWVKETSQEIKDRQDQNFTDENYKAYSGRLPNGKTVGIGSGPLEKLMPDTGSGHYADDFRKRFEKLTLKQFEKITSGKGIENNKASEIYSWIKHPPGKGGDSDSSMPSPQAWMKQLPASHWEKMGLVTMGGGQNYAKDTAKNTRDIANGIKTLVAAAKLRSGAKSPWDMSPNTAQP